METDEISEFERILTLYPPKLMENTETEFFEISAVARLTGISSHVLRVWERRYEAVTPHRSETQRRHYTQADIHRLSLLKTLVDNGHAIGTVAKLSSAQLEERVANVLEKKISGDGAERGGSSGTVRICLAGEIIRAVVREAAERVHPLDIVGEFSNLEEVRAGLRPGAADLLIVEKSTLFPEDIEGIRELVAELGMRRAIVVYRFSPNEVIQPLDIQSVTALRAPVDASEIQLACIADVQLALRSQDQKTESPPGDSEFERPDLGPIPDRAFSDQQLVRVSRLSSAIKCECPQHLANLLSSLAAFEEYSEQCEDRNSEDARLHAFLHQRTADCRSQMEQALAELLKQEGISL